MTTPATSANLLARLEGLGAPELCRLLVEHLTKRKLGLYWGSDAIARDEALNADVVLPRQVSYRPADMTANASYSNLVFRIRPRLAAREFVWERYAAGTLRSPSAPIQTQKLSRG